MLVGFFAGEVAFMENSVIMQVTIKDHPVQVKSVDGMSTLAGIVLK